MAMPRLHVLTVYLVVGSRLVRSMLPSLAASDRRAVDSAEARPHRNVGMSCGCQSEKRVSAPFVLAIDTDRTRGVYVDVLAIDTDRARDVFTSSRNR